MGEAGAINLKHLASNCLAHNKALYKGHAVAAVAATNVHIAEEAAKLIKVDYEVLPSVTGVLDAMKPDAPILHLAQRHYVDRAYRVVDVQAFSNAPSAALSLNGGW